MLARSPRLFIFASMPYLAAFRRVCAGFDEGRSRHTAPNPLCFLLLPSLLLAPSLLRRRPFPPPSLSLTLRTHSASSSYLECALHSSSHVPSLPQLLQQLRAPHAHKRRRAPDLARQRLPHTVFAAQQFPRTPCAYHSNSGVQPQRSRTPRAARSRESPRWRSRACRLRTGRSWAAVRLRQCTRSARRASPMTARGPLTPSGPGRLPGLRSRAPRSAASLKPATPRCSRIRSAKACIAVTARTIGKKGRFFSFVLSEVSGQSTERGASLRPEQCKLVRARLAEEDCAIIRHAPQSWDNLHGVPGCVCV